VSRAFDFAINVKAATKLSTIMCAEIFDGKHMIAFTKDKNIDIVKFESFIGAVSERIHCRDFNPLAHGLS
jgi:hypothetical protein